MACMVQSIPVLAKQKRLQQAVACGTEAEKNCAMYTELGLGGNRKLEALDA